MKLLTKERGLAYVQLARIDKPIGTLLLRPLPSSLSQLGQWFTVGVGSLLSVVALGLKFL